MTGTNACGGCTACCTIMRVEMVPPKPARCQCEHVIRHGCAIYYTRPDPCRDWKCGWLIAQTRPAGKLPSAFRPDRSGVVLEINSAGNLVAHCAKPHSWKLEPMRSWLIGRAAHVRVILETGDGVQLLNADGTVEALRYVGLNTETNEREYRRERN